MSDQSVLQITLAVISLFGTILTAVVTGYFGLQVVRANKVIQKTTEVTLKHVNHAAIAQQKTYAISARMNATLLKGDQEKGPIFENIAKKAESDLMAMEHAQESIDRGKSPIA